MKELKIVIICLFSLQFCISCQNGKIIDNEDNIYPDSTMKVKYAQGFSVDYFPDYKRVRIFNPWQKGEILNTYYLVNQKEIVTPDKVNTLVVPLQSLGVTSCTHLEFLNMIGATNCITGICSPDLVYSPLVKSRYQAKKIVNLGDAFNVNMECLLALHPEALMLASYNQQDENTKRLISSGIPLIYNNEWTESTILARAEWLKLVATFFNQEQLADSLFNNIEFQYLEALQIAQKLKYRPTIVLGGNFKGTWYMPGGKSYMAQLFADAGCDYYYKNDTNTGSLPLNFEMVLSQFAQADYWLNAPVATIEELFAMDERHQLFKAAKNRKVFGFFARTNENANDFWESAIAYPDKVLKDVIWAISPDLMQDYKPLYIKKLE